MFPDGLQDSERPAEALPHQSASIHGSFSEGKSTVLVNHFESLLQKIHGKVSIFRDSVGMISAGTSHCRNTPGSHGARHNRDSAKQVEGAPLEVLAGDVLESLP